MAWTQLKTLFTVTLPSAARSPGHYYGARPNVILGSQLGRLMMKAGGSVALPLHDEPSFVNTLSTLLQHFVNNNGKTQ